jgi:phosphopentomutase
MARAFMLVMDSFGIGAAGDAARFGDEGADTFGHIAAACMAGTVTREGRSGRLVLPNLERLGLAAAATASTGREVPGFDRCDGFTGAYGFAAEQSRGKDTPSGHWEMAGVPVRFEWGYFPPEHPSFPDDLIESLIDCAKIPGVLGNRHASGTQIIDELGPEHMASGKPIVYTSADSVFQVAAHEKTFGLERLYEVCRIARALVDQYNIGRVIARPFIGNPGSFKRTGNRRDLATPPPAPTLLDYLTAEGGSVIAVGKVADIFAHKGITRTVKADGNAALFDATLAAAQEAGDRSLIFTNFVDFDTLYGHRRDVAGYAAALEAFDARLPELERAMQPGDLAVISADHGCDPTWRGTDHTREHVPVIAFGPGVAAGSIGKRDSFADIGQSLAEHLGLDQMPEGTSFLRSS